VFFVDASAVAELDDPAARGFVCAAGVHESVGDQQ